MASDEDSVIVMDAGSSTFRAGFASDDAPSLTVPSVIGTSNYTDLLQNEKDRQKETSVGSEISEKRDLLSLRYPIERGIVTNWDDMETLMAHCFQELRVDPEEHQMLMSDPPLNPKANKERMMELLFEAFKVPNFNLTNSAQLNLYAAGRHTGIMVDIGGGITTAVPFYESHCFSHAIQRQDFGGRDLTSYLQRLLFERGHSFTTTSELEHVREMKESLGCISPDYQLDTNSSETSSKGSYTLPDGSIITLGKERFQCPEALFNPTLAGFSFLKGIPEIIMDCFSLLDLDVRSDICVNFLVTGGCSLFQGFKERLKAELLKQLPPSRRVYVKDIAPYSLSVWIGGSVLGSLSYFKNLTISKEDYFEHGPNIIFPKQSL